MALFGNIATRKSKAQDVPTAAGATSAADAAPGKKRRRPDLFTIILVGFVIFGAGIIAYPTISDWWNSYHSTRAIATYVSAVDETDPAVIEAMLNDARAYNEGLLGKPNRYIPTDAEDAQYKSLLDLTGTGIMGYFQLSRLDINYPIYHGVDESVLQIAIGHIEGSSLPVGGESTHVAISGHRGLPRARLLTDLDKAVEGDIFTITVLNQTLTYVVDQIRIVDPADVSELDITRGADYVTIVTCTPYGLNTHRLLVRGHRTENVEGIVAVSAEAVLIPNYITVPAVAVPMLFIYLLGTLPYYRFRHRGYNRDTVMAELTDLKNAQDAVERDARSTDEPTVEEDASSAEQPEPADTASDQAETADATPNPAEEPTNTPSSEEDHTAWTSTTQSS